MPGFNGGGGPQHPGLVTGHWYGPYAAAITTNVAVSANTLYAIPVQVPAACSVSSLALRIGTQAVGLGKMGIYSSVSGVPSTLLGEVTSDVDLNVAAATLTASFASAVAVSAGWYWLAACFSAATAVPATFNSFGPQTNGIGVYLGNTSASGILTSSTLGTSRLTRTAALTYVSSTAFFPSSFGAVTYGSGSPGAPLLAYLVA